MVNRVEANITGYSSNSKTQTAGDVAAFINRRITLEDNRQPAVWFSRGSFFRYAAQKLADTGILPEQVGLETVNLVLSSMNTGIINGKIEPLTEENIPFSHTHNNGTNAALYANLDVFQTRMSGFIHEMKSALEYPIIIDEGRVVENDELNFILSSPLRVSVAIKRLEYKEVEGLDDGQIALAIRRRDHSDSAFTTLFKRLDTFHLHRADVSDETQNSIVETIGEIIIRKYRGEELPKYGIIFP